MLVGIIDIAIAVAILWFLSGTFGHAVGIGGKAVQVSKPIMGIVLWIVVATPSTVLCVVVRRLLR